VPPSTTPHVVLIDPTGRARTQDATVLRAAGMDVDVVTTTASPVVSGHVDVVVADVRSADSRFGAVLRAAFEYQAPVVVISTADQVDARLAALRYGAADHVVAPTEARELIERVRHLTTGVRVGGPVAAGPELTVDRVARTVHHGARAAALTPSEMDVFLALLNRAGEVVTKDEIAEALPGHPRPNTIEVHVSAIRRKLESIGAPSIKTVHGRGYVLRLVERERRPTANVAELAAQRQRLVAERAAYVQRRSQILHEAHARRLEALGESTTPPARRPADGGRRSPDPALPHRVTDGTDRPPGAPLR
jgi:DNA-binding response OmpR family regulator